MATEHAHAGRHGAGRRLLPREGLPLVGDRNPGVEIEPLAQVCRDRFSRDARDHYSDRALRPFDALRNRRVDRGTRLTGLREQDRSREAWLARPQSLLRHLSSRVVRQRVETEKLPARGRVGIRDGNREVGAGRVRLQGLQPVRPEAADRAAQSLLKVSPFLPIDARSPGEPEKGRMLDHAARERAKARGFDVAVLVDDRRRTAKPCRDPHDLLARVNGDLSRQLQISFRRGVALILVNAIGGEGRGGEKGQNHQA